MHGPTIRLYLKQARAVLLVAAIIIPLLGGCMIAKEAKYGHAKYPAGSGALVDTNSRPISAPISLNGK